jgi:hypothetical protein
MICLNVLAAASGFLFRTAEMAVQTATPGFFKALALKTLLFAYAHPFLTGAVGATVGLAVVYALRRALWITFRWMAWEIPTTLLGVVCRPGLALYRKIRGMSPGGHRVARIPLLGELAYFGPCRSCGTKREYRVRVNAYSGGTVRGHDTISGAAVLGCADCTRS